MTREEAIIHIGTLRTVTTDTKYSGKAIDEAVDMAIKALAEEPCEDAISRDHFDTRVRSALTMTWGELTDDFTDGVCSVLELLKTEPSVQPKPKAGHWLPTKFVDRTYECDNCHGFVYEMTRYCPNCGYRMVEPQESEDKG